MVHRAMGIFLATVLSAALAGCVVLPVPNSRVEGHGVVSQVVDAESGLPISGASVADSRNAQEFVLTDMDGRFKLAPHVQWHFGYQFSAIPYPIWPTTGDLFIPGRCVRIRAAGYEETEFSLSVRSGPATGMNERCDVPLEGDMLLVPSLPLRRLEKPNRHNESLGTGVHTVP